MLRLIAETHGYADLAWTNAIPIDGDSAFPVLSLPETKLEYSVSRGYPIKLEPRRYDDRHLLFVQLESFEISESPGDWATPIKYKPETDEERIIHELGFDEGWENARMECIFVCDQRFSVFWRAAHKRERFGLTIAGGESMYSVPLTKRELGPLSKILKQWSD
jgi:hypothetical protein